MSSTDTARAVLHAWLASTDAAAAERAIRACGREPASLLPWLHGVMEGEASASPIADVADEARRRRMLPADSVAVERWLLIRQGLHALDALDADTLGERARALTAAEIADLALADDAALKALAAPGARFRELARIVTGRRWSAGVYHWEPGGIRRSWIAKVPPRDWIGLARTLAKLGGFDRLMVLHVNGRRRSPHLDEASVNACYAALAETLERQPDLRGAAGSSWIRSPDTHRVSPRLAVVNTPVTAGGGFITTIGRAPLDCGVFARSETRRRAYDEGTFVPTIGLMLWPREDLLRWWRAHPPVAPANAA